MTMTIGDTYINKGDDYWTSGINIGEHGNCIICFGASESKAIALRDKVLAAFQGSPTDAMLDAGMEAFGNTELVGDRFTRRALAAAYTAMKKQDV